MRPLWKPPPPAQQDPSAAAGAGPDPPPRGAEEREGREGPGRGHREPGDWEWRCGEGRARLAGPACACRVAAWVPVTGAVACEGPREAGNSSGEDLLNEVTDGECPPSPRGGAGLGRDKRRGGRGGGGDVTGAGWRAARNRLPASEPSACQPRAPPSPSRVSSVGAKARARTPGALHTPRTPRGRRTGGPSLSQPYGPCAPRYPAPASRRPSPGLPSRDAAPSPMRSCGRCRDPSDTAAVPSPGSGSGASTRDRSRLPAGRRQPDREPAPGAPPPRRPLRRRPVTQLHLCCDWSTFNERLGEGPPLLRPCHSATRAHIRGSDWCGCDWCPLESINHTSSPSRRVIGGRDSGR